MLILWNSRVKDVTAAAEMRRHIYRNQFDITCSSVQFCKSKLKISLTSLSFPVQLGASDCSSKEKHQGRRWRSLFHPRLNTEPQASLQAIYPAQRSDALDMELAFSCCCELGRLHVCLALNINIDVLQSQLVILQSIYSCSFFEKWTQAFKVMSSFCLQGPSHSDLVSLLSKQSWLSRVFLFITVVALIDQWTPTKINKLKNNEVTLLWSFIGPILLFLIGETKNTLIRKICTP